MSNQKQNNRPRGPMGHGMRGGGEKAKDFKGTMKKLLNYIKPFKFSFIIGILCAVVSVCIMVIGPKIQGNIITEIAQGFMNKVQGKGGIDFDAIQKTCALLLAIYALSTAFSYLQGWLMSGVSNKMGYKLRKEMNQKIDKLPLCYFDKNSHGDILSRFTNDVDTLVQSLNQSLSTMVSSFVQIIGFLVMMLSISWKMTLMALIVIPLSLILVMVVVKKSQRYFKAQQKSLGLVNGHIEEMYSAHTIVKAFNGEEDSLRTFKEYNDQLYTSAWKSQFLSGLMMPLTNLIGNIGYVGVCILGGYLTIHKEIAVGDIQSFITYTRNFTQPISQISQSMNMLQSTAAAAERVFEFLAAEEEICDVKNPVVLEDVQGQVTFENVCFGYDPNKIVINNFSMYIKPGQTTAIVGPTGAGKTTIVNLLMKFYEIDKGQITIDGVDTRLMTREEVHDQFSMVLQDTWLFEGTIKENLIYNQENITDEQVIAAAKAVGVHHFIMTLPKGYDTYLDDSVTLSIGQKQLLTIARALLKNSPLLILDEATSSVDTRTEELIQKAMDKLMEGRTSFVIAHRLSTIRNADLILVMKDGNIIEQGNHDDLMQQGGFYADLYNSQFEAA